LQQVEHSDFASLKGFAKSLRRDYAAVSMALTFPWSQGQVHRLKLIKRLGYGRASFNLLRLRVLYGSGKAYQEQLRLQQKKGIIKSA
jgi:transposase